MTFALARLTPRELLARWSQLFALRFLVYSAGAVGITLALFPAWAAVSTAQARVAAWGASLIGLESQVLPGGVVIFGEGSFSYQVVWDCTAVTLGLLFIAAVLAYPATAAQRGLGIAIGLPAIFLLNLGRLISLAWVGVHAPERFETLHEFYWQAFLIATVAIAWFAWIRLVVHRSNRRGPPGSRRQVAKATATFLVTFSFLSLVGLFGRGVAAFGWVFVRMLDLPALVVLGSRLDKDRPVQFAWTYAMISAVVAIFLAVPRVSLRRRLIGGLLLGVPVVVALQLAYYGFVFSQLEHVARSGSTQEVWRSFDMGNVALRTVQLAVILTIWFMWVHRGWKRGAAAPTDAASSEPLSTTTPAAPAGTPSESESLDSGGVDEESLTPG